MSKIHLVDLLSDFEKMRRYCQLGDEPPEFDMIHNDVEHGHRGAHTLERHGPGIPLRRNPRAKTIEGRIYGDPPWRARVTHSYQWTDLRTLNCSVNAYVRHNWTSIRIGLANRHGHEGVADAGCMIGRGYDSSDMFGTRSWRARYRETSQFKIRVRLVSNADRAVPFVLSAFPWSGPVRSVGW